MGRRSVRLSLFVVALLASAGLGYRAVLDEHALASAHQAAARTDLASEDTLAALLDLRGAMHAYLAPNQGTAFWGGRTEALLDTVRQRLITLDTAVAGTGGSLADSLDSVDQLAAADKRARQYVDREEQLLAGDVVFTEVRDLLTAVTTQVTAVRPVLRGEAERQQAGIRREQAALAAGAVGVWLLVALLLLPGRTKPAAKEPGEWRHELADTLKVPAPATDDGLRETAPATPAAPPAAVVPTAPAIPDLKTVAEICADLSTLTDVGALSGALARASAVLGAKGLIVWVASNDGGALTPVSTHGFDPRIVERIGTIDRASANLTAEALRDSSAKVSAATASTGAALAVPMWGPTGAVGVLSAELNQGHDADEGCVAVASILAAQLATLTAPLPAPAAAPATGSERTAESAAS